MLILGAVKVIDLRQVPPHELTALEETSGYELYWSDPPPKIIGGYAVKPRSIAELKPMELAGIRVRILTASSYYFPVRTVYYCPICSVANGKHFTYTKNYVLSAAIGETLSKKFGLFTDKCPVCGSTTYLLPSKSVFIRQTVALVADDTGEIFAVINADYVDVTTADLTGVMIPVGRRNIFYAFGIESIEEPIDYIKVFKMTGTDPIIIAHILATLVKPDNASKLTSVIIISNLGMANNYINLARLVGAKVVFGNSGTLKPVHPYQPVVFIATKYQHLFRLLTYNSSSNLVVMVPFYLIRHVTIGRDITIEFNSEIPLPKSLAQLVIKAVYAKAPNANTPLCKSVKKIIDVQSCKTHLTI